MLLPAVPHQPGPRRRRVLLRAAPSDAAPLRPLHTSLQQATPGVYRVFDSSGALAYTGLSRNVGASLQAHAAAVPEADAASACVHLLPGATSAQLQACWRATVEQHGLSPEQASPKWTAKKAQPPAADLDAVRWSQPATNDLLRGVPEQLAARDYALVEAALPPATVAAAAAACRDLDGVLRALQTQATGGRRDRSAGVRLLAPGASEVATVVGGVATPMVGSDAAAALAAAASLLYSLPAALAGSARYGNLAPPQLLQLG